MFWIAKFIKEIIKITTMNLICSLNIRLSTNHFWTEFLTTHRGNNFSPDTAHIWSYFLNESMNQSMNHEWIPMNRIPGGCSCRSKGMQSRKLSHFLNLLWANFEGYIYNSTPHLKKLSLLKWCHPRGMQQRTTHKHTDLQMRNLSSSVEIWWSAEKLSLH